MEEAQGETEEAGGEVVTSARGARSHTDVGAPRHGLATASFSEDSATADAHMATWPH